MRPTRLLAVALLVAAASPTAYAAPRVTHDRAAARAAWVATYARLARRLPLPPGYVDGIERRATFTDDYALLADAGDLDGDGLHDVVDLRDHVVYDETLGTETDTLRLDARRGRDGALLWSVATPSGGYVFPVLTKVGASGRPGVVAIVYGGTGADALVAGGGETKTTLAAYDHAGATAWTSTFEGAAAYHLAGWQDVYATVDGVLDAVPGGGTDFLVDVVSDASANDPTGTVWEGRAVMQPTIVDGATGTSRSIGNPVVTSESSFGVPLGDLDHDGKDDIGLLSWGAFASLAALRSTDGARLWTLTSTSDDMWTDTLPDVTGDGVPDIALEEYGQATPTIALVDGVTGKVRWRHAGSWLLPIGNVDGRPGAEVLATAYLSGSAARGVTLTAYTGSGAARWSVTRQVKVSDLRDYRTSIYTDAGDTGGDGVTDIGYSIVVTPLGALERRSEGAVNGRTGKVTHAVAKDARGARVAIDGHGTDAYTSTVKNGVLTLTAYRGDRSAKLWTSAFAVGGSSDSESLKSLDSGSAYVFGAYLDKDRCGEVVVATDGEEGQLTLVLSGATGLPLWALSRSGPAAGVVTHPKPRTSHRYAHTC